MSSEYTVVYSAVRDAGSTYLAILRVDPPGQIPCITSKSDRQIDGFGTPWGAEHGAERHHHEAPLCGALKISAPLHGERRTSTSGARTGKISAF